MSTSCPMARWAICSRRTCMGRLSRLCRSVAAATIERSPRLQPGGNLVLTADGSPVEARPLALTPNAAQDVVFDTLPPTARVAAARLDGKDALLADDSAAVVLGNRPPTKMLLVSAGNLFLEKL